MRFRLPIALFVLALFGVGVLLMVVDRARTPTMCNAMLTPNLVVIVRDSRTGGAPDRSVRVVAADGEFRVPFRSSTGRDFVAFTSESERLGTYRVEVRAASYRPWVRREVKVTGDECDPETVRISVALRRA